MPILLEIVTPERKVYSETVEEVVLPTNTGEVGILPGHLPLLTLTQPGELIARRGSDNEYIAVDKGFARVQDDTVSVATEAAIDVQEIDLAKVEEAKERAEAALRRAEEENLDPAEIEHLESITRFAVAQQLIRRKRS